MKALRMIACMLSVLLFSTSLFAADPITLNTVEQNRPKLKNMSKAQLSGLKLKTRGIKVNLTVTPYAQYRDKLVLVAIEGAPH